MIDRRESPGVAEQKQRAQLKEILQRARRMQEHLGELVRREAHRVHFRPGPTGVDMVSLEPDRALQGRMAIRNLAAFAARFEQEWREWCVERPPQRVNVEQRLQAWLIRESLAQGRRLRPLEVASARVGLEEHLEFVTDNLPLPFEGRRLASDLLGVSPLEQGEQGVVLEVSRQREVGLVRAQSFASLVDRHAELFSELFGVLLNRPVRLIPPARRAILWPPLPGASLDDADPAAAELAGRGIALWLYAARDTGFEVARPPPGAAGP